MDEQTRQTANLHGKRLNRAVGAVSAAEAKAIELANKPPTKRSTPADLDPRVFPSRVKTTDDDAQNATLTAAHSAFDSFSRALDDLHSREVTIRSDKTRTKVDHNLRVSQMAGKALEPVAGRAQKARDSLNAEIDAIDREIERSTKSRLSQPEQQEIRAHIKSLSNDDRRAFLQKADADTVSAVLSGKAYLSGLGPAEAQMLEHTFKQREFGDHQVLRGKYARARDEIDRGWNLYMRSVTDLTDPKANSMERHQEAADAALKADLDI